MKQSKPLPKKTAAPPAAPIKNEIIDNSIFQKKFWIVVGLFLLTTLIFFFSQISGNSFFWEDFVEYVYPVRTYAAREFAHGSFPFWNPYSLGGMPFFADIQVGFFYPFNLLLSLFVNENGLLPIWILQFIVIIHFFFAQFNTYILSRYLKISFWGSIIVAISFSFAFPIVLHIIHPMIVFHLTWLPLIFYFFLKALHNSSIKDGAIAGLIFGLTMLSGHPQITLYFALFFGTYFLWDFIARLIKKSDAQRISFKYILSGVLTFIIAVGIFLVQLMPSQVLAGQAIRASSTYEKSSENSLQYKQILTLVLPKIYGYYDANNKTDVPMVLEDEFDGKTEQVKNYFYWETAIYFGVIPLMMGLLGLFLGKKDSFKWFLICWIIFGFLFALGKYFIIHRIFYALPLFGTFRNPVRMMTFSVFGLSIFSGFAFDWIKSNLKSKEFLRKLNIIGGIIIIIAFLGVVGILQAIVGIPDQYSSKTQSMAIAPFIFALLGYFTLFLYYRGNLKSGVVGVFLIIFIFLDLYIQGTPFLESKENPEIQYAISPEMKEFMRPKIPDDPFRVKTRIYDPPFMAVKRNQGMVSKIMMMEGYNPLVMRVATIPLPWEGILRMMNVKYDLKIDSIRGTVSFYENIDRWKTPQLIRNANYIPEDQSSEYMRQHKIDYSKTILLQDVTGINIKQYNDTTEFSKSVKCLDYQPNHLKYNVQSEKNAIMIFSEMYYPDWKGYIDGKKVKIYKADNSFRAIEIPAGNHTVEMKYQSDAFKSCGIISLISFALGIVLIVVFRKEE
ncbi:MAG TPA: YfhO family protein [Candidatus Kapabacteria bacterium]|mgnify:CR=1 FL=1|nr:YfhO family protein [Candidatus Kapabacteria bacterium]